MDWKKNEYLLASILILILSAGAVGLEWIKPWSKKKTETTFFGSEINKFCINDLCLNNKNNEWKVDDGKTVAPANKEMVETYVEKFKKIALEELLSVNQNKFAELGIGISQVFLTINGKSLEIGKIDSNYDGTYVREKDGKAVFDIDMVMDKNHLRMVDQWLNKTITNLAILQIKKIEVSHNGKSISLTPNDNKWNDQKWVEKVAYLEGINYLSNYQSKNPETVIRVETENGVTQIGLGKDTTNRNNPIYWATINDHDYYSIEKSNFNLLTGKIN